MNWGHSRLAKAIADGAIAFGGRLRADALLLTASGALQPFRKLPGAVDLSSQTAIDGMYGDVDADWETYSLKSHGLVLIQTGEQLALNGIALGIIGTLSHVARCGIMSHLESPFVAPDFTGYLTLEVYNASPNALVIRRGIPLAKLTLWDIDGHQPSGHKPRYGARNRLSSKIAEEFGDEAGGSVNV